MADINDAAKKKKEVETFIKEILSPHFSLSFSVQVPIVLSLVTSHSSFKMVMLIQTRY